MNWTEPILLERAFVAGSRRRRIIARLGFPRPTERHDEWACSFQLNGRKDSRIYTAHEVDGLQALLVAAKTLRQWLDGMTVVTSNDEPYEFVLPKFVPISYGLQFHRHLCRNLDAQIKKQEHKLSQKRLSRKPPR